MADSKISAYTETTTPATSDVLEIVTDPAGTPANKKVTVANLRGLGTAAPQDTTSGSAVVGTSDSGAHEDHVHTIGAHSHTALRVLAIARPNDGITALATQAGTSFSTPWSKSVTLDADTDVILDLAAAFKMGTNTVAEFKVFRGATCIYNSGLVYSAGADGTRPQSFAARIVDPGVTAGTYTYEVKAAHINNGTDTMTVYNSVGTQPSTTAATNKGGSVLTISGQAPPLV